jgi:hypothetical protein
MAGKLEVNTQGFKKRVAWRGIYGVLSELISNAFDEDVTFCHVDVEHVKGMTYTIRVEDDSKDGFRNLDEAYTLYADSYKANNPEQRGRFNVGEKVAIVLCDEATIESTTGTRVFKSDGTISRKRKQREKGTVFSGTIKAKKDDVDQALGNIQRFIAPQGITYRVNGKSVSRPKKIGSVKASLRTVVENEEGNLVNTTRKTDVDIYRPENGTGEIFELGVPVVEVDHPFIMDVRQKVPLSVDRNSVTPRYYKALAAAVNDGTFDILTEEEVTSKGVIEGISDMTNNDGVVRIAELRHGKDRFIPDPNNREGVGDLTARGWQSVGGGTYDKETWERIKKAGAIQSVNVFVPQAAGIACEEYENPTDAMLAVSRLTEYICEKVVGKPCTCSFTNTKVDASAQCSGGKSVHVTFHVAVLGKRWFKENPHKNENILELIYHELGHHDRDQDCTRAHTTKALMIASKVATLLQDDPDWLARAVEENSLTRAESA